MPPLTPPQNRHLLPALTLLTLLIATTPAFAGGDVVARGNNLIHYLSTYVGPLLIGLGVIGGAGALVLGIPGAIQKILATIVGGILITSVASVIGIIQSF